MGGRGEKMGAFFQSLHMILTLHIYATLLMSPEKNLGVWAASLCYSAQHKKVLHSHFAFQIVDVTASKYSNPWTLLLLKQRMLTAQSQWGQSGLQMGDSGPKCLFNSLINTHKAWPQCWGLREHQWKEQMQITGEFKQASLPKKVGSKWLYMKGWDRNKVFLILKQKQQQKKLTN